MRTAICPGSFDPVTYGHIDIIRRASVLFDRLIVVVANNAEKKGCFSIEQRVSFLREALKDLKNIEIDSWSGLTAEYARQNGAVAIVRGLRAMTDFEYEFQLALTNKKLCPDCDTVFLTTSAEYLYLSSSLVRQLARFGGDVSEFVPPCVVKGFQNRNSTPKL